MIVPLTEQQTDIHGVYNQVEVFMSAFDEKGLPTFFASMLVVLLPV